MRTENNIKQYKITLVTMQKNGAMLTVACVMLCLTFNYTFPLRRESSKWNIFVNRNESQQCNKKHHENIVDRTKKMAAHIENALKIMKDSDNNENKNGKKQVKFPVTKNTDDDLSHYEQMVIKKKNPYLDLKELELKYYNPKNTRQSVDPGSNLVEDPNVCETLERRPNVEITNRGLSGFAIPTKLLKVDNVADTKDNLDNDPNDSATDSRILKKSDTPRRDTQLLNLLEDDIKLFEERKAG